MTSSWKVTICSSGCPLGPPARPGAGPGASAPPGKTSSGPGGGGSAEGQGLDHTARRAELSITLYLALSIDMGSQMAAWGHRLGRGML